MQHRKEVDEEVEIEIAEKLREEREKERQKNDAEKKKILQKKLEEAQKEAEKEVEKRRLEIGRETMEGLTVEMIFTQMAKEVEKEVENCVNIDGDIVGVTEREQEVEKEGEIENNLALLSTASFDESENNKSDVIEKKNEGVMVNTENNSNNDNNNNSINNDINIEIRNSSNNNIDKNDIDNNDDNNNNNKIENKNIMQFSSQKKSAVSEIEIDAHVRNILNFHFPRNAFGSELWTEQR